MKRPLLCCAKDWGVKLTASKSTVLVQKESRNKESRNDDVVTLSLRKLCQTGLKVIKGLCTHDQLVSEPRELIILPTQSCSAKILREIGTRKMYIRVSVLGRHTDVIAEIRI
jgi:hypothetical protein